jgi:hypothetical protein
MPIPKNWTIVKYPTRTDLIRVGIQLERRGKGSLTVDSVDTRLASPCGVPSIRHAEESAGVAPGVVEQEGYDTC